LQEQVQALNAALPALGLSKVEIQEIDTLASQIQNFNPAACTTLINQFEALAQQTTQQKAANDAANAGAGATQKTPASTKADGSGSQD
jgi:flagellar motor switch protein FliG